MQHKQFHRTTGIFTILFASPCTNWSKPSPVPSNAMVPSADTTDICQIQDKSVQNSIYALQ